MRGIIGKSSSIPARIIPLLFLGSLFIFFLKVDINSASIGSIGSIGTIGMTESTRRRLDLRFLDPKTVTPKSVFPKEIKTQGGGKSRRKFISYTSSPWELIWLNRVDEWAAKKGVCKILMREHASFVHDFLNLTCTSRYEPPFHRYCVIDDAYHPLWYNTENREQFELSWVAPKSIPPNAKIGPPQPVTPGPQHEHIVSKLVYKDEFTNETYVEYIEPLVSHLRFPLTHCIRNLPDKQEFKHNFVTFRGWIIPPPPVVKKDRALYFDAGATAWNQKVGGGPSLQYFHDMWLRHGVEFDGTYVFDQYTQPDSFYQSVPDPVRERVQYRRVAVAGVAEEDSAEHPYLPNLIKRLSRPNDYILFKLDMNDPRVEQEITLSILADPETSVNELFWEHRIRGNYLMREWGDLKHRIDSSLRQSYEFFLLLRQRGIRAHSWV